MTYVSPVLKRGAMWASPPTVGQKAAPEGLEPVIRSMVEALEQAAGLRPGRDRLDAFLTQGTRWEPRAVPVVSFSGGVAELVCTPGDWKAYGDIGVLLGRAIAASRPFRARGASGGRRPSGPRWWGRGATPPSCPAPPSTTGTSPSPEACDPQANRRGGAGGRRRPRAVPSGTSWGGLPTRAGSARLPWPCGGRETPPTPGWTSWPAGLPGGLEPLLAQGIAPWCWWRPTRPRCWVRPWPRG